MDNKKQNADQGKFFASTRRQARISAVQCLYNIALVPESIKPASTIIEEILTDNMSQDEKFDMNLFNTLVHNSYTNIRSVHKTIQEFLASSWKVQRLPETVHAILVVGATEIIYCFDIPVNVTLNEYIEIAKIFNHEGEAGFINGVLDKISKKYPKS